MINVNRPHIRIVILSMLLIIASCLTLYCHLILDTGAVFSHFFYIPSVLSLIWYKKKGLLISLILGIVMTVSNVIFRDILDYENIFRTVVFLCVTAIIYLFIKGVEEKEEGYKEKLLRLGLIVESSNDGIIGCTLDGIIQSWNKGSEIIFGYLQKDVITKSLIKVLQTEKQDEIIDLIGQVKSGSIIDNYETSCIVKTDQKIHVSLSMFPIIDYTNKIIGISLCIRDITKHKIIENKLKNSEVRYRKFFEEDLTGDLILKPDGKIISCNPAFINIFKFNSIEDAIECNFSTLYPDNDSWETFLNRLRKAKKLESFKQEYHDNHGKPLYIIENVVGSFSEEGGLIEIKSYLMDVTEQKKLEDQFSQSQKMEAIGRLAGGVAHDFNNLLTAIIGYSEILMNEKDLNNTHYNYVKEIKLAGIRAASLTGQLLAFSRKQIIKPKVVNPNELITNLKMMLTRIIGEDIDLVTKLDPELGFIKADPGQMVQLIMNLAVNARDAMPEGGKFMIETWNFYLDESCCQQFTEVQEGDYVLLSLCDTGHGMDTETIKHIFEPFYTTKEQGKGTGLGLSMVYGIVKQCGGDIMVKSEVNRGTTFNIYFPRSYDANDKREEGIGQMESLNGTETILIVEDEEVVRSMMSTVLESLGYTIFAAENGNEAMHICNQNHGVQISLLITDIVMPEMGGFALAESLITRHPEIKVLFISGYSDITIINKIMQNDNVSFLQKPFSPQLLAQRIREILDLDLEEQQKGVG